MFNKILGVLKSIFTNVPAIVPILGAFGVVVPPVAIAAVPLAIGLMEKAEEALGDGTGPLKKQAVQAGVNAFAGAMAEYSTGGQKETWQALTPEVVGTLIDGIAGVANALAEKPVFDNSAFENMKAGLTP